MWALLNDAATQITVVISLVILVSLAVLIYFIHGRMRSKGLSMEGGHAFDGILEGLNPTPFGLHLIMAGLVGFAFWYVMLGYPIWNWTQEGQYAEEVSVYKEKFDANWSDADETTLVAMGESLFNAKCVACHGYTGEGQNGVAANLVEFGTEKHVEYVIHNGSKGLGYTTPMMPPQAPTIAAMFGADESTLQQNIANVSAYVMTLSGKTPHSGDPAAGQSVYMAVCMACHGTDGKGMGPAGNIPNFAKDLTTYGTSEDIIRILKHGKNGLIGNMPNFAEEGTLSEIQYQALAAYVSTELN
ncbi:MAG: c-type cytochrome [bacterium]